MKKMKNLTVRELLAMGYMAIKDYSLIQMVDAMKDSKTEYVITTDRDRNKYTVTAYEGADRSFATAIMQLPLSSLNAQNAWNV